MKSYQIAVVFTVKAETYEAAVELTAHKLAEEAVSSTLAACADIKDVELSTYFERDNVGQRVLYLPDERE